MSTFLADGFRDVDGASDAGKLFGCLGFLDGVPDVRVYKERAIDALGLATDARVADLACGMGFDLLRLHVRAPLGRVVGFDASAELVVAARRQTAGCAGIEVRQADARAVEEPDGAFDGVRIDRSLQHIENPARVVAEMARLVRPGGAVSACEPDWSSFHLSSDCSQPAAVVVRDWTAGFRNPLIGRQILDLLADRGLAIRDYFIQTLVLRSWPDADRVFDIAETVRRSTAGGAIDAAAGARLLADLAERHARGRFCATLAIHCVTGRKA